MTEDTLQWIAIAVIVAWLIFISNWIGETTELLKSWWNDALREIFAKEYRDRLERIRGWGPKKPYTPKPLRYPPEER